METRKNSGDQELNEERKSHYPPQSESQKDGNKFNSEDNPVTQNISNTIEEGDEDYDDEELKDEDFDIDEEELDEDDEEEER